MTLLAGFAGGVAAVGLLLLVRELTRRPPPLGTPPRRWRWAQGFTAVSLRRNLIAVAAGLGVLLVSGWPVAGIAAAAAVVFVPRVTTARAQKRRIAVLEGLDQWTRRVSDLLTAGRALEDALEASAASAPAAITEPVTTLARHLATRTGTDAALRAFAAEIGDPAADRIAAALIIATSTRGGGVRNVLSTLADLLARDVAARRQVEAERAQHRTTLRWITGFLIAYTVFALLNRSYSAPFGTFAGQVVLAAVAGLYAVGLAWLHRLGTTPAAGRFLNAVQASREPGDGAPAWSRR
jgi:Flp pilus assembly protein TadB